MEKQVIINVPSHLYASKTKDTFSKSDISQINEAMNLVFAKLEVDRDFPIRISLTLGYGSNAIYVRSKNEEVIRKKFEDVGYDAKIENHVLVLAQPTVTKKQKMDDPPSYS